MVASHGTHASHTFCSIPLNAFSPIAKPDFMLLRTAAASYGMRRRYESNWRSNYGRAVRVGEARWHQGGWLLRKHAFTSPLGLLKQSVVESPRIARLPLDRQTNVSISVSVS